MTRERPRVIFLDAVGTLFGVKGSVGQVYAKLANQFGVEVAAPVLNRAFLRSFKAASPPAFTAMDTAELQVQEFTWWLNVATRTFEQAGVLHHFSHFSEFFSELYAHFATATPWFIYADVRSALARWQQMGIELGVLSNFDSRLYQVLQALELADFFSTVTISTEIGAAKPDPLIFQAALQKHQCPAAFAWHIGDSFEEDYRAAQAVGMRGIWLKRQD